MKLIEMASARILVIGGSVERFAESGAHPHDRREVVSDQFSSQFSSPAEQLLTVLSEVVEPWLQRMLILTAARHSRCEADQLPSEFRREIDAEAQRQAAAVLPQINALLSADVDAQRHNPLALLRSAAIAAGEVLTRHGVEPVIRDDFEVTAFPLDHYRLVPASWIDVDPRLQDPGITWGAWKAAQVLQRRREQGLR